MISAPCDGFCWPSDKPSNRKRGRPPRGSKPSHRQAKLHAATCYTAVQIMTTTRRSFLHSGTGLLLGSRMATSAQARGLKIGVTDWNLQQTGKTDAVSLAKRLGFDGVEVSLGRRPAENKLP